jgi:prepilin-type N-terminal cleavage/methylation domain-containing protein
MNNSKGFTLIELIATMVILSVLAAILIPRYIDAETASKYRALDLGVSEMNGRETLSWALVKLSDEGYRDDDQVWAQLLAVAGIDLGPDYDWNLDSPGPASKKGTLRFKGNVFSPLNRTLSTTETPARWKRNM